MDDGKIHIPAIKRSASNKSGLVRVSAEAYNKLIEIYNDSTLSLTQIASLLILDAAERVVYDKDLGEEIKE